MPKVRDVKFSDTPVLKLTTRYGGIGKLLNGDLRQEASATVFRETNARGEFKFEVPRDG